MAHGSWPRKEEHGTPKSGSNRNTCASSRFSWFTFSRASYFLITIAYYENIKQLHKSFNKSPNAECCRKRDPGKAPRLGRRGSPKGSWGGSWKGFMVSDPRKVPVQNYLINIDWSGRSPLWGHHGCGFRIPSAFQQSSALLSAVQPLRLSCLQA